MCSKRWDKNVRETVEKGCDRSELASPAGRQEQTIHQLNLSWHFLLSSRFPHFAPSVSQYFIQNSAQNRNKTFAEARRMIIHLRKEKRGREGVRFETRDYFVAGGARKLCGGRLSLESERETTAGRLAKFSDIFSPLMAARCLTRPRLGRNPSCVATRPVELPQLPGKSPQK